MSAGRSGRASTDAAARERGLAALPPECRLDALPPERRAALEAIVELVGSDPRAPTTITEAKEVWRVHIADSLSGLGFEALRAADRIADIGAGAGFPGLVIAAAAPTMHVDEIESLRRRCEFVERAIAAAGLANAGVVCERAETWAAGGGREAYDAVTARAVGRLATVAELGSPLLRDGGALLAWEGARDREQERELERAAPRLGLELIEIRAVKPYPGSRNRHIHLLRKNGPTPRGLPRRPGMAAKRPFGVK